MISSARLFAAAEIVAANVAYDVSNPDEYSLARCKLDVYAPKDKKDLPVIVWFHGGGITSGDKSGFPKEILKSDILFVSVNYRLSPKINAKFAIEDAADAIAWTFKNIEKYGGNKTRIYVGGHSAGAYLSGMVGANPNLLKSRGLSNESIAGMLLVSGQMTSHFQVRKDEGDMRAQFAPRIDQNAILWYVENKMPPILLILGDRRFEFKERVEENLLFAATVNTLKTSSQVEFYELQGYNHSSVVEAAPRLMMNFINKQKK